MLDSSSAEVEQSKLLADTERSVLGSIMVDGLTAMDACQRLQPEHFSLQSHRLILTAFRSYLEDHAEIDAVAIQATLFGSRLNEVGGIAYVMDLSQSIDRNCILTERVERILEAWKQREGMKICSQYGARFRSGQTPAADTLAAMQSEVFDAMQETTEQDEPLVSDYSDEAFDELVRQSKDVNAIGLSYGVDSIDHFAGGMQPGQVTVVGAYSGVGKSSLMKQAAAAQARKGIPVSIFSLEMTRAELLRGLWAIESDVEYTRITRPYLLNGDIPALIKLEAAKDRVKGWPLRIYDKADLDINKIVAFARQDVRRFGTKLVCVDYAQSVEAEGRDERTKVASVSSKLTKMAKTEQCSLMLLSQLRGTPNNQNPKMPSLGDLRETTQMGNDAHVVILLNRETGEGGKMTDDVSIIIAKARNGRTGALRGTFDPKNLCIRSTRTPTAFAA